jgi:DNA polymerase delta subunit 1
MEDEFGGFGDDEGEYEEEAEEVKEDDGGGGAPAPRGAPRRLTGKRGLDDGGGEEEEDEEDGGKRARTEVEPEEAMEAHRLASGGEATWARPPLPPLDAARDAVQFMSMDADYYTTDKASPLLGASEAAERKGPFSVIRMYGVTEGGNSVLLHVHDFVPYFYVQCWQGFGAADPQVFGAALTKALNDDTRGKFLHPVLNVEVVERQSVWGFQPGPSLFMKVSVAVPALVATARRLLEHGVALGGAHGSRQFLTYESNVPFVLRFMVDLGLQGAGWAQLGAGRYRVRAPEERVSTCQLEVDVVARDVEALPAKGRWLKIAPIRVLSFDIECAGRKNKFPEPDVDPVIQIANVVTTHGEKQPVARNVFTLGTCASIVGAQVITHERESDMLNAWRRFVVRVDPDLITGYNINNFDLNYLFGRAKKLELRSFALLGRLRNTLATIKDATFSSKAYGTRTDKEVNIDGRVMFDVLKIVQREYKLRSYTLNAVSAHFLKQQKEDVHHSIITDLQNGNDETRHRLAVYCLKDAQLPLLLIEKLLLIFNYVEMARVTGVPVPYLLARGQQIKVVSQLYRKARQHGMVVPVRKSKAAEEKYEGATVIEPERGFYNEPIATLDFASLYPSIMMAHNLCYSTLLSRADLARLDAASYTRTPNGDYFVKQSVRRGLLPEILQELLAARKEAKKEMEAASDQFLKNVLNGRQLALKISANSVYGFTGATVGQLPCLEISSSVTAFGREMIELTKRAVEEHFTVRNGYAADARVVYGDTDSVMVRFGSADVPQAMKMGQEAASLISKRFPPPIKLEFEKVYFPYLLMNKKRYAGLYWSKPEQWDKMDAKGIETVRRDNCALVAEVVDKCLQLILVERSVDAAVEYAKQVIADLLCNRLDLSLLVISKALGKEEYAGKIAHVELAERMRKRDPLSAPHTGDRVPYVIIKVERGWRVRGARACAETHQSLARRPPRTRPPTKKQKTPSTCSNTISPSTPSTREASRSRAIGALKARAGTTSTINSNSRSRASSNPSSATARRSSPASTRLPSRCAHARDRRRTPPLTTRSCRSPRPAWNTAASSSSP